MDRPLRRALLSTLSLGLLAGTALAQEEPPIEDPLADVNTLLVGAVVIGGGALAILRPAAADQLDRVIRHRPGDAFVYGFSLAFGTGVLLSLTLVGLLLFVPVLLGGVAVGAIAVGTIVLRRVGVDGPSPMVAGATGVTLVAVGAAIPGVGVFVVTATASLGLGAVVIVLYNRSEGTDPLESPGRETGAVRRPDAGIEGAAPAAGAAGGSQPGPGTGTTDPDRPDDRSASTDVADRSGGDASRPGTDPGWNEPDARWDEDDEDEWRRG